MPLALLGDPDPVKVALHLLALGLQPLPIPPRSKSPAHLGEGWQHLRYGEAAIPDVFDGMSVGVLTGVVSGDLADVDLDAPEAVAGADKFFAPTCTFGRPGKKRSHRIYIAPGAHALKLEDPTTKGVPRVKPVTIVELRFGSPDAALQTVFPGSIHESGERIAFSPDDPLDPLHVDGAELVRLVRQFGAYCLLLRRGLPDLAGDMDNLSVATLRARTDPKSADAVAEWLGLERRAEIPHVNTRSDRKKSQAAISSIGDAVADYNLDHRREYPEHPSTCPVCGSESGFKHLPGNPSKWCCMSTRHADCGSPFTGQGGTTGYVGDALDLDAHAAGLKPSELLRREGYVGPKSQTATSEARASHEAPPIRPGGEDRAPLLYVADAMRVLAATPPLVPVPTGLEQLDALLDGGLRPKRLHVLCGPPGAGKTAFVGEITRRMRNVAPVLLCSTEIEPDEQAARLVAPLVGTSADALLRHNADPADAARVAEGWPVALFDLDLDPGIIVDPIALIEAQVDAMATREGTRPVVILDYMQDLVTFDSDKRRLGVSSIARRLRQLARTSNVPVLACSSVSRAHYGGAQRTMPREETDAEDPRAWLAAAKESGDVEFASAVLMYLETTPAPVPGEDSLARLIVAKARMGRVGFVGLRFDGARGAFHESAGALASMGQAARSQEEEAKVLAQVGRWRQSPKAWRDLRDTTGIAARRADRAHKRLVEARQLVERRVFDQSTKPRRVRTWVVLPEWLGDALPIGMADAGAEAT